MEDKFFASRLTNAQKFSLPDFNSSGPVASNVFDQAIEQIQSDINRVKDEIYGVPPIPSLQAQIDNQEIQRQAAIKARDSSPKSSKNPDRIYWGQRILQHATKRDSIAEDLRDKLKLLKELQEIDLPEAIRLKQVNASETYNQTFANKGIDAISQQKIKSAEADAIRLAAESKAAVEKAMQKTAAEIQEKSSKTTRTIIILIVVAVVVASVIIIVKNRKNK